MENKLYLAPMEGITGYIFRNAIEKYYGGIDYYVTPFISPTKNKILNSRELKDILPENNKEIKLIPQILCNDAELFIKTSHEIRKYGYGEVNFNLGCPSQTVVTKGRGSGFLADVDKLDIFLEEIFNEVREKMGMDISIKTRIGKNDSEEFESLLVVFNKYPIKLLTIHPRIQKEFYKGKCHLDVFEYAVLNSKNELCYNGDINSYDDFSNVQKLFSQKSDGGKCLNNYMIGRGAIRNPAIFTEISGRESCKEDLCSKKRLRKFHDEIYYGYEEIFSGDRNVLFKMKELWSYLGNCFNQPEKELKKIRKAQKKDGYFEAVEKLFELDLVK